MAAAYDKPEMTTCPDWPRVKMLCSAASPWMIRDLLLVSYCSMLSATFGLPYPSL